MTMKEGIRLRLSGNCFGTVRPKEAIVRLVLKATVAHVEIKRPAGKWEKVAGTGYDQIRPDDNTGIPRGLGLVSTPGFTKLLSKLG